MVDMCMSTACIWVHVYIYMRGWWHINCRPVNALSEKKNPPRPKYNEEENTGSNSGRG